MTDFTVVPIDGKDDFVVIPDQDDEVHLHPLDSTARIFGRLLLPGERMKKGDVFNSMSGRWKDVPDIFFDEPVARFKADTRFIRPANLK